MWGGWSIWGKSHAIIGQKLLYKDEQEPCCHGELDLHIITFQDIFGTRLTTDVTERV
jgi:hypothetical protein